MYLCVLDIPDDSLCASDLTLLSETEKGWAPVLFPFTKPLAILAASSKVTALTCLLAPASPSPRKLTTTGLLLPLAAFRIFALVFGPGGLDIRTITLVSSSSSSSLIPSIVVVPPTFSERSFPPVPIACDNPSPSPSRRVETC